eukprot:m.32176 g.32176  ORF g.32176 m.32176 type:complete len:674 (-) comp9371_c0_seq1:126-2147(-)
MESVEPGVSLESDFEAAFADSQLHPPFRPITPDPRRPPPHRLANTLNAEEEVLSGLPPHMAEMASPLTPNRRAGSLSPLQQQSASVPHRQAPSEEAPSPLSASLNSARPSNPAAAPAMGLDGVSPLLSGSDSGVSGPGSGPPSLQGSPRESRGRRGSRLRRPSDLTMAELVAETQDRSRDSAARGSVGSSFPPARSSESGFGRVLSLSPRVQLNATFSRQTSATNLLSASPQQLAMLPLASPTLGGPTPTRMGSLPSLRLASVERRPSPRDDATHEENEEQADGPIGRPKAARTRTRSVEPIAGADLQRSREKLEFLNFVSSLHLAYFTGLQSLDMDPRTTRINPSCPSCKNMEVAGGVIAFGEGDITGNCIYCRRPLMGDLVDLRAFRSRFTNRDDGDEPPSPLPLSRGQDRDISPPSSSMPRDQHACGLGGEGAGEEEITVGQLRIGSEEPAIDTREDLNIDLSSGLPYLSTCGVSAEALVRYRRAFDTNDADTDGLLNVNQLHVALTALTNHAIRDAAKDFVVMFLQTAQALARRSRRSSNRRKGIRAVNFASFVVAAAVAERLAATDDMTLRLRASFDVHALGGGIARVKALFDNYSEHGLVSLSDFVESGVAAGWQQDKVLETHRRFLKQSLFELNFLDVLACVPALEEGPRRRVSIPEPDESPETAL